MTGYYSISWAVFETRQPDWAAVVYKRIDGCRQGIANSHTTGIFDRDRDKSIHE